MMGDVDIGAIGRAGDEGERGGSILMEEARGFFFER